MSPSQRTLLVVDDESAIRDALMQLLERQSYQVFEAPDAKQALVLLAEHPMIQLVISDKEMPGMSGTDFLNQVRERFPHVCRIMLTGRPDMRSTLDAINRGQVYRFLEKPFSPDHLLNTVHFAFETLELEQQNRTLNAEVRQQLEQLGIERRRSEELLLNMLPATIAQRLKQGEAVIADRFPEATVLFSDLVRFTELSRVMPAAEVVSLLNEIFSAFDQLADVHGVEKIKTIGDGYLAAAGLPRPRADHTRAVANLALGMLDALAAVNQRRGSSLTMRIGVHTGPVVAGVIGLRKFSYDLWGDTVNTASRMEALSTPGRIHVTEAVRRALEGEFTFEPRGSIEVKGLGSLTTHFLLARPSP